MALLALSGKFLQFHALRKLQFHIYELFFVKFFGSSYNSCFCLDNFYKLP